jgi:hypothetical protein
VPTAGNTRLKYTPYILPMTLSARRTQDSELAAGPQHARDFA